MKQKDGFIGERSIVLPQMIIDMEKADPLVSSLYITDIGYYPHARGHYRERKVPIAQHVLIYCVDGAGWYSMGNSQLQRIGANQFVSCRPANHTPTTPIPTIPGQYTGYTSLARSQTYTPAEPCSRKM